MNHNFTFLIKLKINRSNLFVLFQQRLEWQSTDAHRELCQVKGKSADECQNYLRVATRAHGRLLVCGTNAFKPMCRRYNRHMPNHHLEEFDGTGRCPYSPQHNSTAIFTGTLRTIFQLKTINKTNFKKSSISRKISKQTVLIIASG